MPDGLAEARSVFMARPRGETERHRDLKRRAVVWAQAQGFGVCATEVRVPRSNFRADVAACALRTRQPDRTECAIFECKQTRSDLLRDSAAENATLRRLKTVVERRTRLERLLGLHLPSLRRGESLFAECDSYDLDAIQHEGWRRVRREEEQLQTRLFARTKFDRLVRYACADLLYLVVTPGILQAHEAPLSWGILEVQDDGLRVLRAPTRLKIADTARMALLEAIARAATGRVNRDLKITPDEIAAHRARTLPR